MCHDITPYTRFAHISVTTGTVDDGTNNILEAGDTIEYKMEIANIGNTCLADLVVSDLLLDGTIECDTPDTGEHNRKYPQTPQTPQCWQQTLCHYLLISKTLSLLRPPALLERYNVRTALFSRAHVPS